MQPLFQRLWPIFVSCWLVACSTATLTGSTPSPSSEIPARPHDGAYFQNDGPPETTPVNLDRVPDAVPQFEPLIKSANLRYSVMGMSFSPDSSNTPYRVKGKASWYGKQFHGRRTASGERYNMFAMTAAHPTLPIPSYVRVTHLKNGRSVVVRITDRGPFHAGRLVDLSYAAAHRLRFINQGSAPVLVERVWPPSKIQETEPSLVATLKEDDSPKYLQLGAFRKLANAETRLKELVEELDQSYDSQLGIVNHQGVYRVRLGPFSSDAAVRSAAESLNVENIVMGNVIHQADLD